MFSSQCVRYEQRSIKSHCENVWKVEEIMQKEYERDHDSRLTAVYLGCSCSSPSAHEEFKYTDLNSVI